MIYLTTGANGTGKTLNTLKWVREQQLKDNRPVYYRGLELVAAFGWTKIEGPDWVDVVPDGSIVFLDECQDVFPVRGNSAPVPKHVSEMAVHRKRGLDFYLVSQHPQNLDLFIRRLIGSPGWHRHLKRLGGGAMVSQLQWNAVNAACEKTGSGKDAEMKLVPFPKEVYAWYNSAQLHTAKKSIPRAVWVLLLCLVLVPSLFYAAFRALTPKQAATPSTPAARMASGLPGASGSGSGSSKNMTQGEYVASFRPRVPGLQYTAARYDQVTQAAVAPYPAACVQMTTRCKCYSQQGTALDVPGELCRQIVKDGFFIDWQQAGQAAAGASARQEASDSATRSRSVAEIQDPKTAFDSVAIVAAAAPVGLVDSERPLGVRNIKRAASAPH